MLGIIRFFIKKKTMDDMRFDAGWKGSSSSLMSRGLNHKNIRQKL
jgi:hypothetical protein